MSALVGDLRRIVSGRVDDGAPALAEVSRDFGNFLSRSPRVLVEPSTASEVQAVVRYAAANAVPICARGLGHSQGGQSLCEEAIIISTRALQTRRFSGLQARAQAGVLWSTLVSDGAPLAATPRVLTMYSGLTVGGTLSVGGVGANSFAYGQQIDQVTALTVVTGEGELVHCSASSERDLFYAVLGGLGYCALMVDATIALRRAQPFLHAYRFAYDAWAPLLADLDSAAASGQAQFVYGLIRPNDTQDSRRGGTLCIGIESATDIAPPSTVAERLASRSQRALPTASFALGSSHLFAASTSWPAMPQLACPWTDLFFDWSTAEALLSRLCEVGLLPILAAGDAALIRLPDRGLIGCFPMLPKEKVGELLPAVAKIGRVCREEFAGQNYLSGVLPFASSEAWQMHFGERWPAIQAVKHRSDPHGVFHPGLMS